MIYYLDGQYYLATDWLKWLLVKIQAVNPYVYGYAFGIEKRYTIHSFSVVIRPLPLLWDGLIYASTSNVTVNVRVKFMDRLTY